MKKQIMILIVCIVVAAGLGTALWFLMGYEPEGEDESSSAPSTAVQLIEKTDYDLDTVSVENEQDSFVVKNLGDNQYELEGIEDVELTVSMLKAVANVGVGLRADSVVTEVAENLADFGLDNPQVKFTANYTDGTSFSFELGSEAPAGSGYYGRKPGENTVYLVSSYNVGNLLNDRLDFISRTVTKAPAGAAQQQSVLPEKITLGGSLRPEEVVIEKSKSGSEEEKNMNLNLYEMTAPKKRGVDSDQGTTALSGLLTITASDVASYRPDSVKLAEYGLDEPYSTVRFTYLDDEQNEQQVALSGSAPDAEGNVYLMREGVPVVYQLASSSMAWYEMEYQDFLSTLQLLPYIDSVKTMTVTASGKSTSFQLEGEGDELKVTAAGQQMNIDEFRKFYQNVIGIPSEEFTSDEAPAQETALLSVRYEYRDANKPADTLALLPSNKPRRVFLSINGESEFYTKSAYIETIEKNLQNLLAGEKVGDLY